MSLDVTLTMDQYNCPHCSGKGKLDHEVFSANIEEHSKGIVGHYGTKASCLKLVDGRKVVMSYLAFTKAQSRIIQKEIAEGHRKYL